MPRIFSMDAPECQACDYYDDCKNKRMVMCAFLPLGASASMKSMSPVSQPMAVKHDYREVKCGDMTYEIDLEEVKELARKSIERALGCPFLENGA